MNMRRMSSLLRGIQVAPRSFGFRRGLVRPVGSELVGEVGQDEVTAWRERGQVPRGDGGRVVLVRDAVRARDEHAARRAWLKSSNPARPWASTSSTSRRSAGITGDRGLSSASRASAWAGTRRGRCRRRRPGAVRSVLPARTPCVVGLVGSPVPISRYCRIPAWRRNLDRADKELAVAARGIEHLRHEFQASLGRLPVGGEIVFAAQYAVVHARGVRDSVRMPSAFQLSRCPARPARSSDVSCIVQIMPYRARARQSGATTLAYARGPAPSTSRKAATSGGVSGGQEAVIGVPGSAAAERLTSPDRLKVTASQARAPLNARGILPSPPPRSPANRRRLITSHAHAWPTTGHSHYP